MDCIAIDRTRKERRMPLNKYFSNRTKKVRIGLRVLSAIGIMLVARVCWGAEDPADALATTQPSQMVPVRDVTQAIARARRSADSAFTGRVPDYDTLLKAYDTIEALENGVLKKSGVYDMMQASARNLIKYGREAEANLILDNSVDGMNALLAKHGLDIKDLRSNKTAAGIMAQYGIADKGTADDLESLRRGKIEPANPKYWPMTAFDEALIRNLDENGQPLPRAVVLGNANKALAAYQAVQTVLGDASPTHTHQVASIAISGNLNTDELNRLVTNLKPRTAIPAGDTTSLQQGQGSVDYAHYDKMVGHLRTVVAGGNLRIAALNKAIEVSPELDKDVAVAASEKLAPVLDMAKQLERRAGITDGTLQTKMSKAFLAVNLYTSGAGALDTNSDLASAVNDLARLGSSPSAAQFADWLATHGQIVLGDGFVKTRDD